jgi:hypothetical protein
VPTIAHVLYIPGVLLVGIAIGFVVGARAALLGRLDRGVDEDAVVEVIADLGTQQEARVEDRDAAGRGRRRRHVDERVAIEIEGAVDVPAIAAGSEGTEHAVDQQRVVVGVAVVALRRLAPAPVADGARVVEFVDRHPEAVVTAVAQTRHQRRRQGRLAARGDARHRDAQHAVRRAARTLRHDGREATDEVSRPHGR